MFPILGLPVPFLHQSEGDRLWRGQHRIGGGEFSCESRSKLWSSVRDYLGVETKLGKNIGEEKLGHSFKINVFCAGAINYPLCKPMVYHDHD